MMPGVASLDAFAPNIPCIEALGYEYVPQFERDTAAGPGMPFRRYFRKDVDGRRAFHLHVVEKGSGFWKEHLMFRNHLRFHEEDVQAYADLKRRLAAEYNATMREKGIDINIGYTDHKTALIEIIKAKALARIERSTPIALVPYDKAWPERYHRERAAISSAMGDIAVAIEHVGSTSVPGLTAKPTVDVAIGVRTMDGGRRAIEPLFALGYAKGRDNFPDWRYFDREGHAPGDNVHLHMVPFGGERWTRYLLFRDYLRAHPDDAAAYVRLKLGLAAEFGRDRLGYVEAKTDFVEAILARARIEPLFGARD
jgi:GrpB-like predicted nucleotidyltransferase (UPF0157 family)